MFLGGLWHLKLTKHLLPGGRSEECNEQLTAQRKFGEQARFASVPSSQLDARVCYAAVPEFQLQCTQILMSFDKKDRGSEAILLINENIPEDLRRLGPCG